MKIRYLFKITLLGLLFSTAHFSCSEVEEQNINLKILASYSPFEGTYFIDGGSARDCSQKETLSDTSNTYVYEKKITDIDEIRVTVSVDTPETARYLEILIYKDSSLVKEAKKTAFSTTDRTLTLNYKYDEEESDDSSGT